MKTAQINGYGGNEVLGIGEHVPQPAVSPGKVLIEVHAAGVNPFDWKVREGYMKDMAPLEFPVTLGGDFSGVVREVGEGVSNLKIGDRVYGQANVFNGGTGAFAEIVLGKADAAAVKPETVNFTEAAALPLTGVSAYQAIVETLNLSAGQKILIHGGAGGIGTYAIQLAKHIGAYVSSTATGDEVTYVKGLGADEVIDYREQAFEGLLSDFDFVYDTVGGDTYARSFKVLKRGGTILSMLEQPNEELMNEYGVNAVYQFTQVTAERLSKLTELVDQSAIEVHIDKIYPLDRASEALSYLQQGHPRGKVILEIKKAGEERLRGVA